MAVEETRTERAVARVRFEPAGPHRDGRPNLYGFGIRAVCDHCNTPLLVQGATIELGMEEYPMATLRVAAPELLNLVVHCTGLQVVYPDADSEGPRVVELRDGEAAPFPRACERVEHDPETPSPNERVVGLRYAQQLLLHSVKHPTNEPAEPGCAECEQVNAVLHLQA